MCNGVDPTRPDPLTMSGAMDTTATSLRSPRTFASAAECARDVVGVAQLSGPLAAVYLHGQLDATLRERVMVAVSSRVHETEHRAKPAVGAFNDQIEVWSAAGAEKVSVRDMEPCRGAQRTYIPLSAAGTGSSWSLSLTAGSSRSDTESSALATT